MSIKICMIISNYYPVLGGAELQAFRLSQKLVENGLSVNVVTRHRKGLKFTETIEGVNIHRMPCFGGLILSSLTYTLFGLLWILCYRKKIDILHCHQALSPATIGVFAKFVVKKKVIVKLTAMGKHGDVHQISLLPLRGLRIILLNGVDYFVIMSDIMRRQLESIGIKHLNTKTIFNGVDTDFFHTVNSEKKNCLRAELMIPIDCKIVIFTGRLEPQKNLSMLIMAWELFKSNNKKENSLLLIIGEGSQKKEIEALIERSKFKHSIKILEYRSNIRDYLQASDCFVLPSVDEGISNSLLEAMACGLPPIVTKVGSNPEVVEHLNSGILVESGDRESLSNAISLLLSDDKLCRHVGRIARGRIEKYYSLDKTAHDYIELYRSLL